MAIGDYYRLIDYQTIQGQQIVNLYDYQQTAIFTPSGFNEADDLGTAWNNQMLPMIVALQSEQVSHFLWVVGAFGSFTDFSSGVPDGNVGLVTGGCLPSFAAWGYKLSRTTRETRHGSKRIAGVAEAWQQNGVADSPAATAIANLAVALSTPLQVDDADVFTPVILHLDPVTHLPTVSNKIAIGVYRGITTQKSRQPGHGN